MKFNWIDLWFFLTGALLVQFVACAVRAPHSLVLILVFLAWVYIGIWKVEI